MEKYYVDRERLGRDGAKLERLKAELGAKVLGQDRLIERLIIVAITGSHVLLEGLPGVAKTLTVSSMANRLFGLDQGESKEKLISQGKRGALPPMRRVQFIPDLQPSDLLGGIKAMPGKDSQTLDLRFVDGPIKTYFLIADEINRAPSKVQAALLEVMQERTITSIDGKKSEDVNVHKIFSVFATQNPLDQEGTFPLSEAALDRFLFKILVEVPDEKVLFRILGLRMNESQKKAQKAANKEKADEGIASLFENIEEFSALIDNVKLVSAPDYLRAYIARIVAAFEGRPDPERRGMGNLGRSIIYEYISAPCSPRAAESMLLAAQGRAYLYGRSAITAADVQAVAPDVLAHRIRLTFEAQSKKAKNGFRFEEYIVEEVLKNVSIPRMEERKA